MSACLSVCMHVPYRGTQRQWIRFACCAQPMVRAYAVLSYRSCFGFSHFLLVTMIQWSFCWWEKTIQRHLPRTWWFIFICVLILHDVVDHSICPPCAIFYKFLRRHSHAVILDPSQTKPLPLEHAVNWRASDEFLLGESCPCCRYSYFQVLRKDSLRSWLGWCSQLCKAVLNRHGRIICCAQEWI